MNLTVGTGYDVRLDGVTTVWRRSGNSLRLTIKTGDFPKATPTLSTLEDAIGGITTVLYDAEHPSALIVGRVVG